MTLKIIEQLIQLLEKENISYCHWKSNTAINETLSGINDLDLLIAAEDKKRFLTVLSNLNFIRAIAPNEKWFPGISHYYGYDHDADRLVHIHLHDRLILGHDLIKNYHLPIEDAFLRSASISSGLRVPSCELEFIVFVIRMVLKRRLVSLLLGHPRDFLRVLFRSSPRLSGSAQSELEDLQNRADAKALEKILTKDFPFISPELFSRCLDSISPKAERYAWISSGRDLTCALKPYRRHSAAATAMIIAQRSFLKRILSVFYRAGLLAPARKRLDGSGKIIAFVGGDGAGKTTNVKEFKNWFGQYFDVRTIHMGSSQKGFLWYLILSLLQLRKLFTKNHDTPAYNSIKYLLLSYYRHSTFNKAVRLRSKGILVGLDRIPINNLTHMDGPRIRNLTGGLGMYEHLARAEESYYSKIRGVDEIIVLRLDPAMAPQRRPKDEPENLAKRVGEVWEREWPEGYAQLVDASLPLVEVMHKVRNIAWCSLRKRPKVIELIGPAGSGKTTTASRLFEETCNVQTAILCRDNKWQFFQVFARRIPSLINLMLRGAPFSHLKVLLKTETLLQVCQKHRNGYFLPCRNLVLEVGPVFHLSALQMESDFKENRWFKELVSVANKAIDTVVWLDASNEVLKARIDVRKKSHAMKNEPAKNVDRFIDNYRSCFSRIVESRERKFTIERIDTGHESVDGVLNFIKDLLSEDLE